MLMQTCSFSNTSVNASVTKKEVIDKNEKTPNRWKFA